jgi:outer membrane protein assembly factor BamB
MWFGVGLLCAGAVAAVGTCAFWLFLLPAPSRSSWWLLAGWAVLLLLLAGVAASEAVNTRAEARDREQRTTPLSPEISRYLEETAVDAARGGARWVAVIAGVLVVLGGVEAVPAMYGGVPFLPVTLLTLAAGSVAAGALLVAFAPPLSERPPFRRLLGPAGTAIVSVAAVLLLVATLARVLPVDATTTEAGDGLAAVPASVSGVGWTWEAPEGQSVRSAVAAGAGAVVLMEDGVVALDGESGTELWHHRRKGALTASMFNASVGGDLVMVDFVSGADERPDHSLLTVLDAHTGQVRARSPWRPSGYPRLTDREIGLFDDGFVENDAGRSVIGHDPDTLRKKWEYLPPEDCRPRDGFSFTAALDVVVTAHDCAPGPADDVSRSREGDDPRTYPAEVVALDPADGSVVWSRTLTTSRTAVDIHEKYGAPRVEASADGAAVHVSWSTLGEERGPEALLLDQADGSVLAEGLGGEWLPYGGGTTDLPQPWNGFTAQGYLETERNDGEVRYAWRPFSGEGSGAELILEQFGNDEAPGHPNGGLALGDMVLSTQWLYAPDWEELQAEQGGSWFDVGGVRSVAVQGASWDGEQKWELVVSAPVLHEDGITWPNTAPLLPVPGAVLVVSGGATSVVGLV